LPKTPDGALVNQPDTVQCSAAEISTDSLPLHILFAVQHFFGKQRSFVFAG
jgi:hypothetical protein